ncbi:LuxR family transcriptional regulator [Raineyella sp.]|uniref:LuxR family transcriptional regulator n=1 Tax=bioreactor metagenome TaxID=1076179 RepID=A0A644ZUU9_9ZZZZ|nr:LuxR family transcriptional regulator [Raineyella sp.]MEA5153621.1 LuxR family transcriptional regulator [Raineyella sp.]
MADLNVNDIARELAATAAAGDAGRASHTLYGGHDKALRQTLIVLQAGHELAAHESPGEATLLVLAGDVRVSAEAGSWEGSTGDLIPVPPSRHSVAALSDAAILLTVVK